MSLNMPENALISCSDCARVLNMLQYSYNSIIVTNVIMLGADYMEVLSQVEILTQYTKLKKKLQLYEKFQPGLKIG